MIAPLNIEPETLNLKPGPDALPPIASEYAPMNKITNVFADEIRLMTATLRMSTLGGLSVAECGSAELQQTLFEHFRQRLADDQIYLFPFEIDNRQLNLVKSLAELTDQARFKNVELTGKYRAIVIFVHGIEKLNDNERKRFFQLLNFFRDRFTMIAYPIVIWAKPPHVRQMAQSAPDFWSWKSELFIFATDSVEMATGFGPRTRPPLERYIHALLADSEYIVWNDLYLPLKAIRSAEAVQSTTTRDDFSEAELALLTDIFPQRANVNPHTKIIRQGEIGQRCYVLLSGEVEVSVTDPLGNKSVITRLKKGAFFGEIALIKNIPRTATVTAITKCELLPLNKPQLRTAAPKIAKLLALMTNVAEKRVDTLAHGIAPAEMSPLRRFASQQVTEHPIPADVWALIQNDPRTVILGGAGMGKTTALKYITLQLARAAEHNLDAGNPVAIPIFIKLNALGGERSVEGMILNILRGYGIGQSWTEDDIRALLRGAHSNFPAAKVVFVMDGLNEIQGDAATRQMLNQFIHRYSEQHHFIMTCREQDYLPIHGFKTVVLQPLTRYDIESFLVKYMRQERGKRLARDIFSDQKLMELAQTPLALYMFTQLAKKAETLPKNRGIMFDRFTDYLLERVDSEWWKIFGRSRSKTPLALRKQVLAELGLYMQQHRQLTISKRQWYVIIAKTYIKYHNLPNATIEQVKYSTIEDIHEEIKFSGLIGYSSNIEQHRLEFAHHTYQEFFTALALKLEGASVVQMVATPDALQRWFGTLVLLFGISNRKTALFSEILGDGSDYPRVWLAAECLAASGAEIARMTEQWEEELPAAQKFPMLFAVGLASYQMGRYPEALTYLLRAADASPQNAELQYELGALYRQLDQYARAIDHLEVAIRLKPDFVDAYNQLGIAYFQQQKFEEALTIFNATTQLEPTSPYHYFNLGIVQKIKKDYRSARDTFEIALQLKPDYNDARTQFELVDRAIQSGVVGVLESIPMLGKLSLEQTLALAQRLQVTTHNAGETVFEMGDSGDTFFIIESGTAEMLMPQPNAEPAVIKTLQVGDYFGEIALLRAVPRTMTVRCTTDTQLLSLRRKDFTEIMQFQPGNANRLVETSGYRVLHPRRNHPLPSAEDYYDPGYLHEILARQDEVTVVMGDIHGSTFITDAVGPELMIRFLDEYLLRMSTIIVNAGGAMDKSLGDSVMGVFGKYPERPGESLATPALRALLAATQMRQEYLNLREEWQLKNKKFLKTGMGIGIATGEVRVGTVGAEGAMVGAAVNLSNKLSKMAVNGRDESEIYIDQRTYDLLGTAVMVKKLDPEYVLSKSSGVPMDAYLVLDTSNSR